MAEKITTTFGPVTELVTLPARPDGSAITVKVRALHPLDLQEAFDGLFAMDGAAPPKDLTLEQQRDADQRVRKVAAAGIVEPALSFNGDGAPRWDDLLAVEQAAILLAIYRLSGVGASRDAEAAGKAARFPAERGRPARGAAARPALPARKAAQ